MIPVPGWPRISSAVFYESPIAAIDWLCQAFGFEIQMKIVEEGKLHHSELRFGEGLIMVAGAGDTSNAGRGFATSPKSINGGNTQTMFIYVDDIDAHFARATSAGAKIITDMKVSDYGPDHWSDKGYEAADLEGHHWWFAQRIRNPPKQSG